jgi:hypothetical protein
MSLGSLGYRHGLVSPLLAGMHQIRQAEQSTRPLEGLDEGAIPRSGFHLSGRHFGAAL